MFIKHEILKLYSKKIIRYELDKALRYFDAKDYKGLKSTPFTFKSDNNTLNGHFYFYDNYEPNELIIFAHGLSSGYLAYMPEIEKLAALGYKVLAYDNTGCVSSEGKSIRALSQSLADLDHAISALREMEEYKFNPISVVGHSWGGYAALNIRTYQDNIKSVIALSGFISVSNLLNQYVFGLVRPFKQFVLRFEKEANPEYYKAQALDSFKHLDTNFLVIHSKDDDIVSFKHNALYLKRRYQNDNVSYLFVDKKVHGPQYSKEAVGYNNQVMRKYRQLIKDKKLKTEEERIKYMKNTDFYKLSTLDKYIWQEIDSFLKR